MPQRQGYAGQIIAIFLFIIISQNTDTHSLLTIFHLIHHQIELLILSCYQKHYKTQYEDFLAPHIHYTNNYHDSLPSSCLNDS